MPTDQTATNQTAKSRQRRTDTRRRRRAGTTAVTTGARSTPGQSARDETPPTAERSPLGAAAVDVDTSLGSPGAAAPDPTCDEPVSQPSTDDREPTDDTVRADDSSDDTSGDAGAPGEVADARAAAPDSEQVTPRPGRDGHRYTRLVGRHRLPHSAVRPPMVALLSGVVYLFTVGRLHRSARRGRRARQSLLARPRKDGCSDHR